MSEEWAERERRTNRLARLISDHVFKQKRVTPLQLYGIAKLSWITGSFELDDASYIRSTKIPALGDIFKKDYSKKSLSEVAADVANEVAPKFNKKEVERLVKSHTGFTNFYNAYRNSAGEWVRQNHPRLLTMFKAARKARSDKARLSLIRTIKRMPGIPKANNPQQLMPPEFFLTPVLFMLDEQIKFPLINGNKELRNVLRILGVQDAPLEEQYKKMVELIGTESIKDAADLDQARDNLAGFITGRKKLLEKKKIEGRDLPLKDEADFESLQKARSVIHRRIHNELTNKLKDVLPGYTLLEGKAHSIMFDVLVKNYDRQDNDLLIEVKSSTERAHIRMAVGQLFDYCYHIKERVGIHLAILLPKKPDHQLQKMLKALNVGVMWFDNNQLKTEEAWLQHLENQRPAGSN